MHDSFRTTRGKKREKVRIKRDLQNGSLFEENEPSLTILDAFFHTFAPPSQAMLFYSRAILKDCSELRWLDMVWQVERTSIPNFPTHTL